MALSESVSNGGIAPRRVFWDWSRPLLDCAVDELTKDWKGGTLDLSHCAVVVPTGEAGRRLREALVLRAEAVVAPRMLLPDELLDWGAEDGWPAANEASALLAWAQVLQEMNLKDFPALFPREPDHQDFPWALHMASTLRGLQQTLGEAGWSIGEAADRLGPDFEEAARWQELTQLESAGNSVLARANLRDRDRVRSRQAWQMSVPDGIRKLFVMAVSDPLPLAVTAMESLLKFPDLEILVCIHASPGLAHAFDAWGRPDREFWSQWTIPIPDPHQTLRAFADPAAQGDEIARLCAAAADPSAEFAIGIIDAEIVPQALASLADGGMEAYHPQGTPFRQHPLHWLLSVLQELLAARSWEATRRLLHIPEVLKVLAAATGADTGALLTAMDEVHEKHLPSTLDDALKFAGPKETALLAALEIVRDWLQRFSAQPFAETLTEWLAEIVHPDAATEQAGELLMEHLDLLVDAARRYPQRLSAAQCLHLLLKMLQDAPLFTQFSHSGILLSGWLELPWQNAPSLILTGCNEGGFPPAITSDPWLPHGLRAGLKLKTNETRFARDAYLLTSLLASRRNIHCLFGHASADGDPLKPSRLLMQCEPEQLADRVQQLFADLPATGGKIAAPWKRAWQLRPGLPKDWDLAKISITSFQKYLTCPFRFFLGNVLRMEKSDPLKQELNARDFGNLCHHALDRIAKDPVMRNSTDVTAVREFLQSAVAQEMHRHYGASLSLPLQIQLHTLRQRLGAAAEVLVASSLEGWEVRHAEIDFSEILGTPWMRDGIEITGRIDRVEYHPERQRWRVIDYKTSSKPVSPMEAHVEKGLADAHQVHLGAALVVPDQAKPSVWSNLQLPLYAAVLGEHFKQPVEAAYFNLPPALTQTGILVWKDLWGSGLIDAALECADAVIGAIRRAHFWPPNPKVDFDDFERLFIRGTEESIDPSLLLGEMERRASGGAAS